MLGVGETGATGGATVVALVSKENNINLERIMRAAIIHLQLGKEITTSRENNR